VIDDDDLVRPADAFDGPFDVIGVILGQYADRDFGHAPSTGGSNSRRSTIDEPGGAVSGSERNEDDSAAIRFHELAADDLIDAIIGTLDQNGRPDPAQDLERGILFENPHEIDSFECRQHFGASLLMLDRPTGALEPSDGGVAVEADDEPIA